jgi:hypothetical protein
MAVSAVNAADAADAATDTDVAVAGAEGVESADDAGGAGAGTGVGGEGDSGSGREGGAVRSALVEAAAELHVVGEHGESVPRVEEVGVLGASPLEAALVFPPLPAEVIRDGAAVDEAVRGGQAAAVGARGAGYVEGELMATSRELADGVERADRAERADEADRDGAGGGVGAGDASVGGGAEVRAEPEVHSASVKDDDRGAAAEAGPEFAGDFGTAGSASMPVSASVTAVSLAWAVVPLVSMGLLTPVSLGYAAYRLRSRKLAAATAWYTVAVSIAFAISATHPSASEARTSATSGGVLTACLAASWVGGTVHSFLIRRRVFR